MSTPKLLLTILATSAVLAAVGIGPRFTGNARALPPAQTGITIPYSGRLSDEAGKPVADGAYDFTFALYAAESGGEPLWAETQEGVAVKGGAFTVLLGRVAPLPQAALDGGARWLEVGVRGPGETDFTALSPRQELTAATPDTQAGAVASANGLSCWHTHWGETWSGSGTGLALYGNSDNSITLSAIDQSPNGGYGVFGLSEKGIGVAGRSDASNGYGVFGRATATSGETYGVYGWSSSPQGRGVYGYASNSYGANYGVYGRSDGYNGTGVYGYATHIAGYATSGVYGRNDSTYGRGVTGWASATSGYNYGVIGESASTSGTGVFGYATATSGTTYGVYGRSNSTTGYAGYFWGNVHVTGNLSAGGSKPFKIDHPLDPAGRYLYHFAQEAPEVQNVYNGLVTLDANGEAVVTLPAYFSALNAGPFLYQLTPIGAPMPNLYVAQEIQGNIFKIAGGVPGKRVSWEVTAVRNDPYMRDHPAQAEVDKPAEERGTYLYPEGYGQPQEKGLDYQRNPELFRQPPPGRSENGR